MDETAHASPVRVGTHALPGELQVPERAGALVVFAHESGSSRASPRNRRVAAVLHQRRLATLLFDLLTEPEQADRGKVFDIELLAERLAEALDWIEQQPALAGLRVGLFGASTGAGAALVAAASRPARVGAVVSRGGRPDLAANCLPRVSAPTLLIVGSADTEVLDLNRQAFRLLGCNKRLEVVPDATHLFQEPGTLRSVADLAAAWFDSHLVRRPYE